MSIPEGVTGKDEGVERGEYVDGGVRGASYIAKVPSGGGDGEQDRSEFSKPQDAPQVE